MAMAAGMQHHHGEEQQPATNQSARRSGQGALGHRLAHGRAASRPSTSAMP
jgi:hypothetical protein